MPIVPNNIKVTIEGADVKLEREGIVFSSVTEPELESIETILDNAIDMSDLSSEIYEHIVDTFKTIISDAANSAYMIGCSDTLDLSK